MLGSPSPQNTSSEGLRPGFCFPLRWNHQQPRIILWTQIMSAGGQAWGRLTEQCPRWGRMGLASSTPPPSYLLSCSSQNPPPDPGSLSSWPFLALRRKERWISALQTQSRRRPTRGCWPEPLRPFPAPCLLSEATGVVEQMDFLQA